MSEEYKDIESFVERLNGCGVPYLVLRNYENMLSPGIFVDGHEDLDLLASDSWELANAIGAKPYTNKVREICSDGTHFYVVIGGRQISLDIRHSGDGYYCTEWERDMLERRIVKNGISVMSDEDYFYSYIHHTILQKRRFTGEAKGRLCEMAGRLGIALSDAEPKTFIGLLEKYMRSFGYRYTYPTDTFVPLNSSYIDRKLIERDWSLAFRHWKFDTKVRIIELLVKIKHLIFR